jgi:hypothetical protein
VHVRVWWDYEAGYYGVDGLLEVALYWTACIGWSRVSENAVGVVSCGDKRRSI